MRLRSLTKHIRDQNWFAVALDFFIVVAGILIAFQITNWNEARKINGEAKEFTNQLKADLAEEAWVYESVIEYYGDVRDNTARVVDALEGKSEVSDQALVIAAYRATQYVPILRRRETFDELTATGRINLIGDEKLRRVAKSIYDFPMYELIERRGYGNKYREAFRMLIPSGVQTAVTDACGDKFVEIMDYEGIIDSLDYACSPEMSDEEIKAAADILRTNETVLPLLRLRLAELEATNRSLTIANRDIYEDLVQYRTSK